MTWNRQYQHHQHHQLKQVGQTLFKNQKLLFRLLLCLLLSRQPSNTFHGL